MRRSTVASLIVGAGFMLCTGALFIVAPDAAWRGLYTPDAMVLALAALLLPIAGVFQVFDGLQVVAIGLLRGLGDTRMPMIINVIGFWCIGMPVSLWLGFGLDYGAVGLWWGLVVGLVIVAVFLIVRVRQREKHGLERIIIDEHAKAVARRARRRLTAFAASCRARSFVERGDQRVRNRLREREAQVAFLTGVTRGRLSSFASPRIGG